MYKIDELYQRFIAIQWNCSLGDCLLGITTYMNIFGRTWGRVVASFAFATKFEDSPTIRNWLVYVLKQYARDDQMEPE